ncbi:MAG: hypothetical protein EBZ49_00415 [Proteobacteria bacterium]|nr:hypothetical protein [Pseudomonadota bacterium]
MTEFFLNGFIKQAAKYSPTHLDFKSMSKRLRAGYRKQTGGVSGLGGMLMMLPAELAAKVVGKKARLARAVRRANTAALAADTALGKYPHKFMSKMPFGKELFVQKDMLPMGKGIHKEVKRTSVLAPASKLTSVASPVIVGITLDKQMRKLKRKPEQNG